MFRTRALTVLLVVAGIIGATPLAADASIVRVSGTVFRLPDGSKMQFPATQNVTIDPFVNEQWTADGPQVATKVGHLDAYKGQAFVAAWAYSTAPPSDTSAFYTQACAHVANDPNNPATMTESHSIKIGKIAARICTFSTATGTLSVLFVFNGSLAIKLAEQQIAPDVSQAPLFSTYVKTLKLAKISTKKK